MASPYAFVTLLTSDHYLPGALALAAALRDVHPSPAVPPEVEFQTVCLVTPESVDVSSIKLVRKAYDVVIGVELITQENDKGLQLLGRPDLNAVLTKLHIFRLTQYSKIIFLDADVLPIRPLSHLFTIPHEFSAVPDVGWPDIFNSGVLVLSPGEDKFSELQQLLKSKGSWDGGDQGLFNEWRGNNWNRLSFTYNTTPTAAYTYAPAYERFGSQISAIHFIGPNKPWKSIPYRAPFVSQSSQQSSQPSQQSSSPSESQAYDYNSLLDRWFNVYDKHYRSQTIIPETEFEVRRYVSAWDEQSGTGAELLASAPAAGPLGGLGSLGLEELRRLAIQGMNTTGFQPYDPASGEGEYRSMPLEGRVDLMRPPPPPKEPDPEVSAVDSIQRRTPGPNEVPPSPSMHPVPLPPSRRSSDPQQGHMEPSGTRYHHELHHHFQGDHQHQHQGASYDERHHHQEYQSGHAKSHDGHYQEHHSNQHHRASQPGIHGGHYQEHHSDQHRQPSQAEIHGGHYQEHHSDQHRHPSQAGIHGGHYQEHRSDQHRQPSQAGIHGGHYQEHQLSGTEIHSGHYQENPPSQTEVHGVHYQEHQSSQDGQSSQHGHDEPRFTDQGTYKSHDGFHEPQSQHSESHQHQPESHRRVEPPRPPSPPKLLWNPAIEPPPKTSPAPNAFPSDTYFPNVWDQRPSRTHDQVQQVGVPPAESGAFFQPPPPAQIPESLLLQGHYRQVTGDSEGTPNPDATKVKSVFPWEGKPRHRPGRVFPASDQPPAELFTSPVQEAPPVPPPEPVQVPQPISPPSRAQVPAPIFGLPSNLAFANAWDNVPSIQRYASRLVKPPQPPPTAPNAFDLVDYRRSRRMSWGERIERSSRDGDDEDNTDDDDEPVVGSFRYAEDSDNETTSTTNTNRNPTPKSRSRTSSISAGYTYKGKKKEYRVRGVQTTPREMRSQGIQVSVDLPKVPRPSQGNFAQQGNTSPRARKVSLSLQGGNGKRWAPSLDSNALPPVVNTGASVRGSPTKGTRSPPTPIQQQMVRSPREFEFPDAPPLVPRPVAKTVTTSSPSFSPPVIGTPTPKMNANVQLPAIQPVPMTTGGSATRASVGSPGMVRQASESSSSSASLPSSTEPVSPSEGPVQATSPPPRKPVRVFDPARGVDVFKRGSEEVLARFLKMSASSWEVSPQR